MTYKHLTIDELTMIESYYLQHNKPVEIANRMGRTIQTIPVVLVNFNILKNISKFLQNVVVLDLIEHCKPVICFQIYSLAL
ncbi:hypothetical protein EA87_02640 [Enterococcus faecium]|nr:hypothetical protein CG820_12875 [Enterococcus faecium]RBT04047.1 hypothetical protein EA87_02640 [Enterococcus faecium]